MGLFNNIALEEFVKQIAANSRKVCNVSCPAGKEFTATSTFTSSEDWSNATDMASKKWITPFRKQVFVVLGVSINMAQIGMVMSYAAGLLSQLRAADSTIPIDDSSGSWIAALPGFALVVGNLTIPTLMAKLGRRKANLISIIIIIAGWAGLATARNITWILIARFLQGLSAGMSACLTPILIGEYTSPKNRGAFTVLMSIIMAGCTLTVHTLGSFTTWKMTALVITIISLVDLLIVALSPETPSWLADQGRHEECEKAFRWLRGDEEIDELRRLIQRSLVTSQSSNSNSSVSSKIKGYILTVKKKEFYKPIIIMIHLYTMGQWAGINILGPYIVDIAHYSIGTDVSIPFIVVSVDVQRVISCVLTVFIIKKVKRRTMLFTSCGLNVLVLLVTAGYVYAKTKNAIYFDHPLIGLFLLHALMMTVAVGSLPLPFTIAGEIFALKYRSLSSGITAVFCSINVFLPVKTFPFLIKNVGLYGAYCLYSGIMVYCLVVVWFLLPETKDRTLHEIEEEFKDKLEDEDLKAVEPLTVIKDIDVEK